MWCDGEDHESEFLENKLPTGEWMDGWSLALSSSVDVCPLEELSTSDTPESAGLGGKEPESNRKTHQENDKSGDTGKSMNIVIFCICD